MLVSNWTLCKASHTAQVAFNQIAVGQIQSGGLTMP